MGAGVIEKIMYELFRESLVWYVDHHETASLAEGEYPSLQSFRC